jgi:hypothetical protein
MNRVTAMIEKLQNKLMTDNPSLEKQETASKGCEQFPKNLTKSTFFFLKFLV